MLLGDHPHQITCFRHWEVQPWEVQPWEVQPVKLLPRTLLLVWPYSFWMVTSWGPNCSKFPLYSMTWLKLT